MLFGYLAFLIAAVTLAFISGLVLGIRSGGPDQEELSAAYSRGCGDCRCQRPIL